MIDMHCAAGLGRVPTLCVSNGIVQVAKEAQKRGMDCCCEWDQQKEPVVNGKVNLAYVARNLLLKGAAARSTFGQVGDQFIFLKAFAAAAAKQYGQGGA